MDIKNEIIEEFSDCLERRSCLVIRALPKGRLKSHSWKPLRLNGTELFKRDVYFQCVGAMYLNPSIPVFVVSKDEEDQCSVRKFDGTFNSIF